jgi:hypothetical protein
MSYRYGIGSLRAGKAHGHASSQGGRGLAAGSLAAQLAAGSSVVDDAVREALGDVRPDLHQDRASGGGSPDFGMLQSRISALQVRWGRADQIVFCIFAAYGAHLSGPHRLAASASAIGDA